MHGDKPGDKVRTDTVRHGDRQLIGQSDRCCTHTHTGMQRDRQRDKGWFDLPLRLSAALSFDRQKQVVIKLRRLSPEKYQDSKTQLEFQSSQLQIYYSSRRNKANQGLETIIYDIYLLNQRVWKRSATRVKHSNGSPSGRLQIYIILSTMIHMLGFTVFILVQFI